MEVIMTTGTAGATIFYTSNTSGFSTPTHSGGTATGTTFNYSTDGPAIVGANAHRFISALAYKSGLLDSVVSQIYEDNLNPLGPPPADPGPTEFAPADDADTNLFAAPETNVRTIVYGMDPCGNRKWVTVNGSPSGYAPNELNQYSVAAGLGVTNGDEHELREYLGSRYIYLGDTYLAEVYSGPGVSGYVSTQPTYDYLLGYDALGRCVKRTFNGQTTLYVYDGEHPILEFDPNGTNASSNIYGRGLDEILARNNNGGGQYFLQDRLGNVLAVVGGDGTILESYTYDAYGAPSVKRPDGTTVSTNISQINNRFLFTGREYLPQYNPQFGGFYEYRARAYRPGIGRFMSEDPKGFDAGDYNLYRYCHNDPLDKTDPMGLEDFASVTFDPAQPNTLTLIRVTPQELRSMGTANTAALTKIPETGGITTTASVDPKTRDVTVHQRIVAVTYVAKSENIDAKDSNARKELKRVNELRVAALKADAAAKDLAKKGFNGDAEGAKKAVENSTNKILAPTVLDLKLRYDLMNGNESVRPEKSN
jgi:RHS repeat-associated protein